MADTKTYREALELGTTLAQEAVRRAEESLEVYQEIAQKITDLQETNDPSQKVARGMEAKTYIRKTVDLTDGFKQMSAAAYLIWEDAAAIAAATGAEDSEGDDDPSCEVMMEKMAELRDEIAPSMRVAAISLSRKTLQIVRQHSEKAAEGLVDEVRDFLARYDEGDDRQKGGESS